MKHLTTREASVYLIEQYGIRRAVRTLQNLRHMGGGPSFKKTSPTEVYYAQEDLDAWAHGLLDTPALANTAQYRPGGRAS